MLREQEKVNFENKELQEIYDKHKVILEENISKLNSISKDIKSLETVFKSDAFPPCFCIISLQVFLEWDGSRIVFRDDKNNFSRPFIECKSDMRMEYYCYLKTLLNVAIYEMKKSIGIENDKL